MRPLLQLSLFILIKLSDAFVFLISRLLFDIQVLIEYSRIDYPTTLNGYDRTFEELAGRELNLLQISKKPYYFPLETFWIRTASKASPSVR